MGGRSGSSGRSSISGLPSENSYKIISKLPSLTGSEKQISYATKIRNEIGRAALYQATARTSDGRPSSLMQTAKKGNAAIKNDINNNALIKSSTGSVKKEKIKDAVNGYKDLSDRISRVNEVLSNSSAKFWIDNKYGDKIMKYIDTGKY